MPGKKYIVRLTDEERSLCEDTLERLSTASQKARCTHIQLLADADGPDAWIDAEIAKTCRCRTATVEYVRRRCVPEASSGPSTASSVTPHRSPSCLTAGKRQGLSPCNSGRRRGATPRGRCACSPGGSWNSASSSRSATRPSRKRQKTGICGRKLQYRVFPPEADAEFAAGMEGMLEAHARPHDEQCLVLSMDEQPVQLVREIRTPRSKVD